MENLLTVAYRRVFDAVRIDFMDDGSVDYVAIGEVSDEELDAMIEAEGNHVDGWESEIIL